VGFALRLQQLDGDVVECHVGFVAGDVGEAAAGVADLTVGHDQADFGFVLDGVDDIGGTERDVEIGHIVLMEKGGIVRGNAHAENADVGIFKDEMMVRFLRDGDGAGGSGVQNEREHQQTRAEKQVQSEPPDD
jgi:hypothetical protein